MRKLFTWITLFLLSVSLFGCSTDVKDNDGVKDTPIISNETNKAPEIKSDLIYDVEVGDTTFDLATLLRVEDDNDETYTPKSSAVDYQDFDVSRLGYYTVNVSVEDSEGLETSKQITLHVVDTTAPTIELVGEASVSIVQGTSYTEKGVTSSDNYDTNLETIISGVIDLSKTGVYVIEYTVEDSSGNKSLTISRTITVISGDSSNNDNQTGDGNTQTDAIDEDGLFITRDEVALYIYTYNKLPNNYMTKSEAGSHISNYWTTENMASIGGDQFYNREKLLPEADGRTFTEVDIDYNGGNRGSRRIVYSSDGYIFYTSDHYNSFKLYEPETKEWVDYSLNDFENGSNDQTGDTTNEGNTGNQTDTIDENGKYINKDDVALYIYTYDKLPSNYMTKSEAGGHISNHWTSSNMASIGGDRFYNREGLLPETSGRTYYEVDIDYNGGNRGSRRIVYSNDGFIFYTGDHYDSFKLYDPETKEWVNYSKNDPMFD